MKDYKKDYKIVSLDGLEKITLIESGKKIKLTVPFKESSKAILEGGMTEEERITYFIASLSKRRPDFAGLCIQIFDKLFEEEPEDKGFKLGRADYIYKSKGIFYYKKGKKEKRFNTMRELFIELFNEYVNKPVKSYIYTKISENKK